MTRSGRVYLPEEDLARFGVAPEDFSRNEATLGVREASPLRGRARLANFMRKASELTRLVDADSRGALWALVRIYSALLRRIEVRDFDGFLRTRAA